MATAKPDTGHGATLTLSTNSGSYKIRAIPKNLEESLPVVDISHLGTTGPRETMPGDLTELGEIEVDILFEAVTGMPSIGTVETATITFPLQSTGATTAANIAGTAFIRMRAFPSLQTNGEMLAKIGIKYDGATGPTFTAAS